MSMCRCAPRSCARRSSGRSRSAASRLPRSGASGRSSGVSAHTFTDRFARGSAPAESRSSCSRAGHDGRRPRDRVQRVGAAVGVALRLGLRDRRLAQQVDRRRHAVLPQVLQVAQRGLRVLADDEAVRHVLDARRGRHPQRAAPGLAVAHLHRHAHGRRRLADVLQERGQVPRQVVEVAAGGHDVDEAEQRGLELGVRGGEVHRLVVERLQRVARRRQGGRQLAAHLEQLAFHRPLVGHRRAQLTPPVPWRP